RAMSWCPAGFETDRRSNKQLFPGARVAGQRRRRWQFEARPASATTAWVRLAGRRCRRGIDKKGRPHKCIRCGRPEWSSSLVIVASTRRPGLLRLLRLAGLLARHVCVIGQSPQELQEPGPVVGYLAGLLLAQLHEIVEPAEALLEEI